MMFTAISTSLKWRIWRGVFNADRGLRVIAVSDDLESSLRTLELEKTTRIES